MRMFGVYVFCQGRLLRRFCYILWFWRSISISCLLRIVFDPVKFHMVSWSMVLSLVVFRTFYFCFRLSMFRSLLLFPLFLHFFYRYRMRWFLICACYVIMFLDIAPCLRLREMSRYHAALARMPFGIFAVRLRCVSGSNGAFFFRRKACCLLFWFDTMFNMFLYSFLCCVAILPFPGFSLLVLFFARRIDYIVAFLALLNITLTGLHIVVLVFPVFCYCFCWYSFCQGAFWYFLY